MDRRGARATEDWNDFYEFTGTKLGEFPLAEPIPIDLASTLDRLAQERAACLPQALVAARVPTRAELDAARTRAESLRRQMIAWQEELDWRCYRLYGLAGANPDSATLHPGYEHPNPPEIAFGERAFEIVLARRMAAGEEDTTWFARHNATPITELPAHWPADYRRVVEARIALIESDKFIGLIERPEYKRRWATTPWAEQEQAALKGWLLDRLETPRYWPEPVALTTTHKLADRARRDADFMQVAELYAGRADFDVSVLVAELVTGESVPFLPVLRYSEAGLRKREQWETTWALQRREDEIDAEVESGAAKRRAELESIVRRKSAGVVDETGLAWIEDTLAKELREEKLQRKQTEVGDIPVPPKYKSTDFLKTDFWRLRGGLDVPKERWVSYPGCERGADGSLPIAWAGWDALKQATAVAGYYIEMKENEGWDSPASATACSPACWNWCHGSNNGTTTTTPNTPPAWATTSKASWWTKFAV